jgi:hypothetical protein
VLKIYREREREREREKEGTNERLLLLIHVHRSTHPPQESLAAPVTGAKRSTASFLRIRDARSN